MSAYQDQRVVVTGAGGGIGAALARRFAAEGATVVVNDLDPAKAASVADGIGARAIAVPGDASTIVERAREALGGAVDVYCANAGLASGGDAFVDEAVWEAAWDVNVMAHVRAARALLPQWLERGSGRFVSTVSAAGLLTMIGAAPYSVTKHGALAFAEWLSLTYRHRGVQVHAVCPQGPHRHADRRGLGGRTRPGADRDRAGSGRGRPVRRHGEGPVLDPPAPRGGRLPRRPGGDPDRWLTNMNHLQQKWETR